MSPRWAVALLCRLWASVAQARQGGAVPSPCMTRAPSDRPSSPAQRAVRELYVSREATDTNQGRLPARSCPCLRLLVVHQDETFDGDEAWWMLCPRCQSGWVRELSRAQVSALTR